MKKTAVLLAVAGMILSCGLAKKKETRESQPPRAEQPVQAEPGQAPREPAVVEIDGATAALEVIGWSRDSRYFAFGQSGNHAAPLDEEQGFGDFRLVEVAEDRFVDDVTASIYCKETRPVTREDIARVRERFEEKIKPYGITEGTIGEQLAMRVLGRDGNTERVEFTAGDGRVFEARMIKEFNYDAYPCEGRFELVLKNGKTGRRVTLQKAGKFYPARMGYAVHSAYADPSGEWVAVFTLKTLYGFEGAGIPEFMVNTGRLP